MSLDVSGLGRNSDWTQVRVQVLGMGVAGFACADNLAFLGANVTVMDERTSPPLLEKARLLESLDAVCILGRELVLAPDVDLLVVSPGLPPSHPVIQAALAAGLPVWGELELAWRLRDPADPPAWLCVTGTNGKTTTTLMLESMLLAAGYRATAAGNIGRSLVEAVMDPAGFDVIAVEVGAPQLPFVYSMSPFAAVCLNLAEDHTDHFGSFAAYAAAKAKVFERTQVAAVYNAADEATLRMVEDADVVEGCRAIAFTLGTPARSELGVVEDLLVDRAFIPNRETHAQELALVSDVHPAAAHNVANALAAAALARAFGVEPAAVRQGLIAFEPAAHRVALVAVLDEVAYINDSKATNCHAAQTAIGSYERVVWIAGGDAKGQNFADLVAGAAPRLAGVVLLGRDRGLIAAELRRSAPAVPVVEVADSRPEAMFEVVRAARDLARPGDTVLLAPACASWDMFDNYGHRGDLFTAAVGDLGEQ